MASTTGKVLVGDELRIIDKISIYEELQEIGQAYYTKDVEDENEAQARVQVRSTTTVKVPWNEVRTSHHIEEYDSGWRNVGDGKKYN